VFPADRNTAPADVGLDDPKALPFKLTISCVNFRQSAEFQRTLFNIDQSSPCNTFKWAATDSNGINHSSRPLPDRPRLLGAFVEGQIQGLLEFCRTGVPGHSEVALVVAPYWRRKGLGWASRCDALGLTDACAKHPDDLSPYQLAYAKDCTQGKRPTGSSPRSNPCRRCSPEHNQRCQ